MKWFDEPTQVIFADPTDNVFRNGIAYRDEIICGCCGSVFPIATIKVAAENREINNAISPYSSWSDLSEAIFKNAVVWNKRFS